ncbi:hypothetical protein EYC80_001209 [Monilinia laxa]|uniref:Uncharacterized protein n=1 Tax=Monilinia laxa TaxID=61186 RepID=A0A5N6K9F7_MONLA|nr:hypothetical protein EYC80_001209 [Monilinia laxa]
MQSKKVSNKGQTPSQQAADPTLPANEPKAKEPQTKERKAESQVPEKDADAAKPKEQKPPSAWAKAYKCPRCSISGFIGACHTCGWGTNIGID